MICSVLIPSRKRFDRLKLAIKSFIDTAAKPNEIEFIVRLDDVDLESVKRIPELSVFPNVHVIVGDRKLGYGDVYLFYSECADLATAPWCAMMNDDAVLTGDGYGSAGKWDDQLAGVPTSGYLVQPEIHQLGPSVYRNDAASPVPFVPTRCWKTFGLQHIPTPVDMGLHSLLVETQKWNVHYLRGVRIWHQRDTPEEMEEHRKM